MIRTLDEIEEHARVAMVAEGHAALAPRAAKDCAWLEACGYPGLKLLAEALSDPTPASSWVEDAIGMDLNHISCVFITPEIENIRAERGRVFLRNVRHGLYLVPGSVRENYGIGCPIDPGFALGGERGKNPYVEKLAAAMLTGVEVADEVWNAFGQVN